MSDFRAVNDYLTQIYFYTHYVDQGKISHNTIRVLQLLDKRPCIGIGEVAKYFEISHNTASENIKRLVKKGYIAKEKNFADERKVELKLTAAGKKVLRVNTMLDEDKLRVIFDKMESERQQKIVDGFRIFSEECEAKFNPTIEE
ncbi:MAG TPA: MarR family winged helix-turn-helix transcriptional regulator [Bellilinea sp.]|nr:MarR family winged helix-turn-helix transcriptional regulator [Bellilinea sp.]